MPRGDSQVFKITFLASQSNKNNAYHLNKAHLQKGKTKGSN